MSEREDLLSLAVELAYKIDTALGIAERRLTAAQQVIDAYTSEIERLNSLSQGYATAEEIDHLAAMKYEAPEYEVRGSTIPPAEFDRDEGGSPKAWGDVDVPDA